MFGHRRPSSFAFAPAWTALLLCAVLGRIAMGQASSPATLPAIAAPTDVSVTPTNDPVRIRITWGGGDAQAWIGRVQVDRGSLSKLKLLGLDADTAGSAWLEGGKLRIGDLSPHESDGVEIVAEANSDAQLMIDLAAAPTTTPTSVQVALANLAKRPHQMRLDDHGNTLEVAIIPDPVVQISIKHNSTQPESLIFPPGQQLSFEAMLELPGSLHGTTVDVQTTLTPTRRGDVPPVWADNQKLNVPVEGHPKIDLDIPLQQPEGVYTVRVAVARPSGYFRDKFFAGAAPPLAERSFEVAIIDSRKSAPAAAGHWTHVLEIDPTNPGWIDRLPSWTQFRRIPGLNLNHGSLGSIRAAAVQLPTGRFIELPPTAAGGEPHWQAYTLPLEAKGEPHVLEVDYPVDEEQHLGFTILEPNAVGVVEGVSRDTGVFVEGLGRTAKQKETARILFWPRTQTPLLVVTNRHPTAAAHFGPIRVQRRNGPLNDRPITTGSPGRLVAALVARPLVAESFGASQSGAVTGPVPAPRGTADLQTFYEAASRLSDHLRFGGYNAAVVSALADGSSIFPLASTSVTPFYNSGRLANQVQESDGLELALRVFDREGLTLIPAVEFAAPLAKLEELRRASEAGTSGLEWIGPDGHTWLDTYGARRGLAPYYNLLDPRVQEAILDIVAEIATRYGNHASFGGLAVQLTGDGYAQLPPPEWGLDDSTIARFEQATGIAIPATGPDRFKTRKELLTSQYSEAWRSWRAAEVARFYDRLAKTVRGNTDRRVLLTTEKLFDHPQIAQRIRPTLRDENRSAASLLDLGLDRQLLERSPGITLCPTLYVESAKPLPDCANDLELNAEFSRWRKLPDSDALPGGILYHRPKALSISSFAARVSPTLKVAKDFRFLCEPNGYAALARKPYLQALAGPDPGVLVDGGDLLSLVLDDKLREMRTIISKLPLSAQVSEVVKQPVVVRTFSESAQTTIVVMNVSPWAASAQVSMTLPASATFTPLVNPSDSSDAATAKPIAFGANQQPWVVTLAPYDVQAIRVDAGGAKVVGVDVDLDGTARPELKAHLADLKNRDVSASRQFQQLPNPSFEPTGGAAQVAGWNLVGKAAGATIQLDATAPQHGKTSLYLRNSGALAAVESDPIPIPATGQLAMSVFARSNNAAPGTVLQLVFESESGYHREASVPCGQLVQPNQGWGRPLAILSNDLPSGSDGTMRVVFKLTGPGEVWIDNVVMYDLLFPLKWYGSAQAEIFQLFKITHAAENAYEKDQLSDCLQLLDSYWPRFVQEYTPLAAPKVAALPAPPQANNKAAQQPPPQAAPQTPPANQGQQATPGVVDRLKSWVPIPR